MGDLFAILVVILIIVLIVRGPKTLPLIGGMLGRGLSEARKEAKQVRGDRNDDADGGTAA